MALYEGTDYDTSVESAGDGVGVDYTNWDQRSIMMCDCDYGYFGPDCSLGACLLICVRQ